MCRFLLVKSKEIVKPEKLLKEFALMCQKSHSPDGDWQGDGWGVSWEEDGEQKIYRSLKPVWDDKDKFSQIPQTNYLIVHARSSGFPDQKGIIEYNQPYTSDGLTFVFNGMVRGVKIPYPLEGKIGAQKIFSLLQIFLRKNNPAAALESINGFLMSNSKKIEGLNLGIMKDKNLYALCQYENNPEYFTLNYYSNNSISMISSLDFGAFSWKKMKKGEILSL